MIETIPNPDPMRRQVLWVPGRAWTLNAERRDSWRDHRDRTREWRRLTALAALGRLPGREQIEPMDWCEVSATVYQKHPLADTGNAYPAIKAMIDGLVDCGMLSDDTGEFVRSIRLAAPVRVNKDESVCLVLRGPVRDKRWRRWQ